MRLRVKELREQCELSQSALAKLLGKSLRTVQAWEMGESFPKANEICMCAEIFGTDPNDVLGWYDDHDRPITGSTQDPNEAELVRNYRDCTPDRKRSLLTQSSDAASASRGCAERDAAVDCMSA